MSIAVKPSRRMASIGGYAFAEVRKLVSNLKMRGIEPIDFGVGDPLDPTPDFVRARLKSAADEFAAAGYPSYVGSERFRQACAAWMQRRFGLALDWQTELCSTIGSKEAVFHFPEAFVEPGDVVLVPSPGYPPMKTGTLFAEGRPYFLPLLAKNDFLIDFRAIPQEIVQHARLLWLNYPNSPSGAVASRSYYEDLVAWAHHHGILIAADEGCYIDVYLDEEPPVSILQIAREGIITFYSLSKRNNMTGYRVGFVAGDARIVEIFKNLKTHIDSGTPTFIQEAAIAALQDDDHVCQMREHYRQKQRLLLAAFDAVGMATRSSHATFFVWQPVPAGQTSWQFTQRLLQDDMALVVTPGAWLSDVCADGCNPGEGYVRFALVPPVDQVAEAARRIRQCLRP